jgi:hypothetical protein
VDSVLVVEATRVLLVLLVKTERVVPVPHENEHWQLRNAALGNSKNRTSSCKSMNTHATTMEIQI